MNRVAAEINIFEKIVAFLGKRMEKPLAYGAFHIVSLIIILSLAAVIIVFRRRITEAVLAKAFLVSGIIMAVLEVYKQIVMSYNPITDVWEYQWYIFPFQFCSTPTYITLIAYVLYKLKKREAFKTLTAFLGTYSLVAAFVVLFVGTSTVTSSIIGVSVQTMVHHGLMLLLSVMILSSGSISFGVKTAKNTFNVFFILVIIAVTLNRIFARDGRIFDMFYLAPDSTFVYPIFNAAFNGKLPHPIYILGYIVLFSLAAFLILFAGYKITKIKNAKSQSR